MSFLALIGALIVLAVFCYGLDRLLTNALNRKSHDEDN